MKRLIFFLSLFFLAGCSTTYTEIYHIEKYPISWQDTIYYKRDHWHFKDTGEVWLCANLEADTIVLNLMDTISVPIYKGTYKK